ncbi:hypothetical protein C5167_014939 [Papaver somniferum]|uniref:Uncharacterized protein n=1 Tax=Papaver somniferum TaxID=3469 RepID=A0A4Y7J8Z4_PAPSO|nr:hypothetical protein C5167_014939 [Papaver somniferum]
MASEKAEKVTITDEKGHLNQEEIERMVQNIISEQVNRLNEYLRTGPTVAAAGSKSFVSVLHSIILQQSKECNL